LIILSHRPRQALPRNRRQSATTALVSGQGWRRPFFPRSAPLEV